MEWMEIVIAGGPDLAQRRFQLLGTIQRRAVAERKGRHPVQAHRVQSTISVPSTGNCQPARSAISRSAESVRSAGFELLICRNIFRPIPSPARLWMAPSSPDI